MALSITAFAALITANIRYSAGFNDSMKLGILYLIYTAAALIMFVVNEVKYLTGSLIYFTSDFTDLFKETCLGFFVVVLGFMIWLVIIYTKYPNKHKRLTAWVDSIK